MSKRPYRVGRASAGLGLFATAPFKKGEFVVAYRGRRINNAEAAELERRNSRYIFEINSRWSIDGSSRRNIARYVNHSCRPNAEAYDYKRGIGYYASRSIKPGDEITLNYGKDYFELFIGKQKCRCAPCLAKRYVRRSKRL